MTGKLKKLVAWILMVAMLMTSMPTSLAETSFVSDTFSISTLAGQNVSFVVKVDGEWTTVGTGTTVSVKNWGGTTWYVSALPTQYGSKWFFSESCTDTSFNRNGGRLGSINASDTDENGTKLSFGWGKSMPDGSLYARPQNDYEYFTVKFLDGNGTELSSQLVQKNKAAVLPTDVPNLDDDHVFDHWVDANTESTNIDLTSVGKTTTVKAVYKARTYTVEFQDGAGNVLSKYEGLAKGASVTAPEVTVPEGKTFQGWSSDGYMNVQGDLIITPVYTTTQYDVTFVDEHADPTTVAEVKTDHGLAATAPDGYVAGTSPSYVADDGTTWTFSGWDADFSNVTSDITVKAMYEQSTFSVVFMDRGAQVGETQYVKKGESATTPEGYVVGQKVNEDDTVLFREWSSDNGDYTNVTSNMIVTAMYSALTNNVFFFAASNQINTAQGVSIAAGVSVPYGEAVPADKIPVAGTDFTVPEGMEFKGWNVDLSSITKPVYAEAVFEYQEKTVNFVDADGKTVIASSTVKYDETVTAPNGYTVGAVPTAHKADKTAYAYNDIFSGWEPQGDYTLNDITHVHQDMTFKATFRNYVIVRIIDQYSTKGTAVAGNATILSVQTPAMTTSGVTANVSAQTLGGVTYNNGKSSSSTPKPSYTVTEKDADGNDVQYTYNFTGWSGATTGIKQDTDIYALFVRSQTVTADGNIQPVKFFIRTDGVVPEEPKSYSSSLYTGQGWGAIDVSSSNSSTGLVTTSTSTWITDRADIAQRVAAGTAPAFSGLSDNMYIMWYVIKKQDDGYHVDGVLRYKNNYKVIYTTYGGTAVVDDHDYQPGATVSVVKTVPTYAGYDFAGWATEEGGNVVYKPGDPLGYPMPEHDVYLYAVWVSKTATTQNITVTKQWLPASEGTNRTVDVILKRHDASNVEDAAFSITQSINGNGTTTFENLPIFKDNNRSNAWVYYVEEATTTPGFTTVISGRTIRNIKQADIKVVKQWQHPNGEAYNNYNGKVSVTLTGTTDADGKIEYTALVGKDGYTFKNIPLYDSLGYEYHFTVTEATSDAYEQVGAVAYDATARTYTITNKLTQELREISVTKVWDDDNNTDGLRPDTLFYKLTYTKDNTPVTTYSGAVSYNYTFTDVPSYNLDGSAITDYAVEEMNVTAGYEATVAGNATDGFTITNKHAPATTSVSVRKEWVDGDNADGLRKAVTATLYYKTDGMKEPAVATADLLSENSSATQTLSTSNNWRYTWTGLRQNKDGKRVTYSVVETEVPTGYAATYTKDDDGTLVIVNTHTPIPYNETGEFTVTKSWVDGEYGKHPDFVSVTLMKYTDNNPTAVAVGDAVTLTAPTWSYTWTELPKYENGVELHYTVSEEAVDGYDTGIEDYLGGCTVTNTSDLVSLTVAKVVEDNTVDSANGLAQKFNFSVSGSADDYVLGNGGSFTVAVHKGSTVTVSETVNTNIWSTTNQLSSDAAAVNGASREITVAGDTTITFTNTRKTTGTDITLTKKWEDQNDEFGLRPDAVTLTLMHGAQALTDVTLNKPETDTDTWTAQVTGITLPAYEVDGNAYTLSVDEKAENVPTGYTKSGVDQNTLTVTNTLNVQNLTVTKKWVDGGKANDDRPAISIVLTLNETATVTAAPVVTKSDDNTWTFTYTNIPAGTYTIDEETVPTGYTKTNVNQDELTITNTIAQRYTNLEGTKTWVDNGIEHNNADEVILTLRRSVDDGTTWQVVDATPAWDGNNYKYTNLPVYDENGYTYTYSVIEDKVNNYNDPEYANDNPLNITNRITQTYRTITVTKVWEDNDNVDDKRPDSITIQLWRNDGTQANDALVGTATMYATEEWKNVVFSGLETYNTDNGKAYTYTVKEVAVNNGYTTTYSPADGVAGNSADETVTVNNKRERETTEFTVTKIWRDGGVANEKRPEITIQLYADGEATGQYVEDLMWTKGTNEWTYTFTNLDANTIVNGVTTKIVYSAKEEAAPNGYTNKDSTGSVIVNTALTTVTATKVWEDQVSVNGETVNNPNRPASVTLKISGSDGGVITDDAKEITGTNNSATWENLPTYASNGNKIVYTVEEIAMGETTVVDNKALGYTVSYSPDNMQVDENYNIIVTNELQLETVTAKKVWVDAGFEAYRPDAFTLQFLDGDNVMAEKTVTAAAEGTYSQDVTVDLPRYDKDGKDIEYTVVEKSLTFGTTEVSLDNANFAGGYVASYDQPDLTVTNTLQLIDALQVNKVWNDASNGFDTRPTKLTLKVTASDSYAATGDMIAEEQANSQSIKFTNLPKYERGTSTELTYTVEETAMDTVSVQNNRVMAYEVSYDQSSLTVTNTLPMVAVKFEVEWVDADNKFNTRPEQFTATITGTDKTQSFTVSGSSGEYSFDTTMPKYNNDGTVATYTVTENSLNFSNGMTADVVNNAAAGYTVTGNPSLKITNTMQTTSVNYKKVWEDIRAYRPANFTLHLGAAVGTQSIDMTTYDTVYNDRIIMSVTTADEQEGNGWSDMPVYNLNLGTAEAIAYTITETALNGVTLSDGLALGYKMTSEVDGNTFTITNTLEGMSYTVNKEWIDPGDATTIANRPAVQVQLLVGIVNSDNEPTAYGDKVTLVNDEYTWNNLPTHDKNGNPLEYTVDEVSVDGYERLDNKDVSANGVTLVNRSTSVIGGTKTWYVPEGVSVPDTLALTLNVYNAETDTLTPVDGATCTWLNTDTNVWTYSFGTVPEVDAQGNMITYRVTETLPEGFISIDEDVTDFNLVNTALIDVTGKKVWVDGNGETAGVERPNITINLYRNDTTTGNPVLVEKTVTWKNGVQDGDFAFEDLPYADADGSVITYTVAEADLPEADANGYFYKSSQTGNVITNILYMTVPVSKVWNDNNDNDGLREAATNGVTILLSADGQNADITPASYPLSDENATYSFTVPVYDAQGQEISYKAFENGLTSDKGYSTTITGDTDNGFIVTNSHESETIKITVTKIWDDQSNNDRVRPDSLTVAVSGDNDFSQNVVLTKPEGDANNTAASWSATITANRYYNHGIAVTYTADEDEDALTAKGYAQSASTSERDTDGNWAFTFTNTRAIETVEVQGTKTWQGDDADTRPTDVELKLKKTVDDTTTTIDLTDTQIIWSNKDTDVWSYSIPNLPKYENGKLVTYEVAETPITGYEAHYAEPTSTNNVITINLTNVKLEGLTAYKVWHDSKTNDERDNVRFQLYQTVNGETKAYGDSFTVAETAKNGDVWTMTFEALPTVVNGAAATYTVDELDTPTGYTKVITADGLTIHNYEMVSISGTKTWNDDNNRDGLRPTVIDVQLYRKDSSADSEFAPMGDEYIQHVTPDADGNWKYEWDDLPGFGYDSDFNFTQYTYAVREVGTVEGYNEPVYDDANYGITNTHTIDEVSLTITKNWDDDSNRDGKRPDGIDFLVESDDESFTSFTVTLTDSTPTSNTWSTVETISVPKNKAKTNPDETTSVITYKVTEGRDQGDGTFEAFTSDDYTPTTPVTVTMSADADLEFSFTNKHESATKTVTVEKAWNIDELTAIPEALRPVAVEVQLMKNGEVEGEPKMLAATATPAWTATWEGLNTYEDGELITYTVTETAIYVGGTAEANRVAPTDYGCDVAVNVNPADASEANVGITVTNTLATTAITVNKVWRADVPTTWTVGLYRSDDAVFDENDILVETKNMTADDTTYTWTYLPTTVNGVTVTYFVRETAVGGVAVNEHYSDSDNFTVDEAWEATYAIKDNVTTITNYELMDVIIIKKWVDGGSEDRPEMNNSERPFKMTVTLSADGQTKVYTAPEQVDNSATWTKLNDDEYRGLVDGKIHRYGPNGGETTIVSVTEDDQEALENYTATVAILDDIDTDTEGKQLGAIVTNTLKKDVIASKTWIDGNSADRPDTVQLTLYAGDTEVQYDISGEAVDQSAWTKDVEGANGTNVWTRAYPNLPLYDGNGNLITYTLREAEEDVPEGYMSTAEGLNVTNTLATALEGTKTWEDGNDVLDLRPDDLTITLTRKEDDGSANGINEVTLTEGFTVNWNKDDANFWVYTIENLPAASANYPYIYTANEVLEDADETDNYRYVQTANEDGNFVNRLEYVELTGEKIWRTGTHAHQTTLTYELLKTIGNATSTDRTVTVTGIAANATSTELTMSGELPVFDGETRIVYTLRETVVGDSLQVTTDGAVSYSDSFTVDGTTNRYAVTYSEDGMTIINTLQTIYNGTKVWDDAENNYLTRPNTESFLFNLVVEGDATRTVQATAQAVVSANNPAMWTVTFGYMTVVDEANNDINYIMVEDTDSIRNYTAATEHAGISTTITNTLPLTNVTGTKTWIDGSRTERPDIDLTLMADGVQLVNQPDETWTNTDTNVWTFTFADVPAKNAAGENIVYTVVETMSNMPAGIGYDVSDDGLAITNTIAQDFFDISGEKIWVDVAGTEHGDVTIELLRDGEVVATDIITNDENSYEFTDLPMYALNGIEGYTGEADGHTFTYDVREVAYPGYVTTTIEREATGNSNATERDFINTIEQEAIDITVNKVWEDDNDRDGIRAEAVIELLRGENMASVASFAQADGETGTTWTVPVENTVNAQSNTFTGLDRYFIDTDNRVCYEYVYAVNETTVPEGYTASYDQATYTVFNAHQPEMTTIAISKLWDDDSNRDGLRTNVNAATFVISNDGDQDVLNVTIRRPSGATTNDWGTWKQNVLVYNNHGTPITYTVQETNIPVGYTANITNGGVLTNDGEGSTAVVTNVHVPETTTLGGTKTWIDGGVAHNNATDVSLTLHRTYTENGASITEDVAGATPSWNGSTYSFDNLPQYKAGSEGVRYTYTVTENAVAGYSVAQDGNNFTNTLMRDVTITVNWVDGDQFYRPTAANVLNLLANGVVVNSTTMVDPTTTGVTWNYTFTNVPAYDADGNEIVYTVDQPVTPGNGRYDAEQSGLVVTNTAFVIVTFIDYNGRVIKTDRINLEASTDVPATPVRAGYRFTNWSGGTWTQVIRDQVIRANYVTMFDLILDPDIPLAGGTVQNVGDCLD